MILSGFREIRAVGFMGDLGRGVTCLDPLLPLSPGPVMCAVRPVCFAWILCTPGRSLDWFPRVAAAEKYRLGGLWQSLLPLGSPS